MLESSQPKPFNTVRNFLWPIHGYEHRKLLPMLALFFLISFVYNVLRCMKVTLVVTAAGSSAEVIPFLKVWAVLPGAVLLTYLYTKLANRFSREFTFYFMIIFFLGFFTLFLLFLHPNREALEITRLGEFQSRLTWFRGLGGFLTVIRHWHLSLFYVLSDLWSAIVLSMLFWGFANEVTTVHEAKRFYAIFALGANFSGIFSGQIAQFLTLREYNPNLPFGKVAWEQTLDLQLGVVLILGTIIILLYRWLNISMLSQPRGHAGHPHQKSPVEEEPKKLSLIECFSFLGKSRYMMYITILVVAYNIIYNISDVLWTDQVSQRFPTASAFNAYINQISSITGVFATLSGLLLSGNVIRSYGWTVTAIITPLIWLICSMGFLGCLLFKESMLVTDILFALFQMPIYSLVLFFGSAQICLGRAAKYTVFDETKEIAFIPLSKEEQRKGKAVVDGIASRFGKSGGSLLIQFLLVACGELALTIPYFAGIFVLVFSLWFAAVRGLGKMVAAYIDTDIIETPKKEATEQNKPIINLV